MAIIKTDNSHYTNIANAIRSKSGTETQFKPSEMPQGVEAVFNAGYEKGKADNTDSYYDIFWDNYQDYGNYSGYRYGKGWSDENFRPKYDLNFNGGAQQMFLNSEITNLVQILKDLNIGWDTSRVTNFESFIQNSKITHLPTISTLGIATGKSTGAIFYACRTLQFIEKIILKSGIVWSNSAFSSTIGLITIGEIEGYFETSVNMFPCSLLDDETIQRIISALADLTGQEAQTITFHSTVKAKLTEEQISTITSKNWTLA